MFQNKDEHIIGALGGVPNDPDSDVGDRRAMAMGKWMTLAMVLRI